MATTANIVATDTTNCLTSRQYENSSCRETTISWSMTLPSCANNEARNFRTRIPLRFSCSRLAPLTASQVRRPPNPLEGADPINLSGRDPDHGCWTGGRPRSRILRPRLGSKIGQTETGSERKIGNRKFWKVGLGGLGGQHYARFVTSSGFQELI